MVNAKLIRIVRVLKFASNSVVVLEIVLMLAVNSHAVQMLCVFRIITDQHVFAAMVSLAIQMISIQAVYQSENQLDKMLAKAITNVDKDKFVLLDQMVTRSASIHVHQLHAV